MLKGEMILPSPNFAEESEGEIIVALYELLFLLGQADVLARILQRLTHILSDEEDASCRALTDDVEERPVGYELRKL